MNIRNHSAKLSLGSFNFIKGVAISIIIFGHISLEFGMAELTWFYPLFFLLNFLKTPFIPLFFIISGYGFKANSTVRVLRKTAKSLIVPYILVMFAYSTLLPLSVYIRGHNLGAAVTTGISVALSFLLGLPIPGKVVWGYTLSHCAIVWFLLAAFWGYNILNLILKQQHIATQILSVIGCAICGYWLFRQDITYYCIPHGLIATTYFYVGYLLKKTKLLERGLPQKWMYYLWCLVAMLYATWGYFDLCYGDFAFFPVDYIGVVFLAVLLLYLGLYVEKFDWKIVNIISNVGVYSYWVLCIHGIEQKCLPWKRFAQLTQANPNIGFILSLIIKIMIITSGCIMIRKFSKWKYRKQKAFYERKKLCTGTDSKVRR